MLWRLLRYPLYRLGLIPLPMFTDDFPKAYHAFAQLTRMNHRLRVRDGGHVPRGHPAIYAGNHALLGDPFYACGGVHAASNKRLWVRFVMRDDFFDVAPWKYLPFPVNDWARMGGAYPISRQHPSIGQLKPLLEILMEPLSFVIFPGRTRSRSGLFFEYREGMTEPGSVAFFQAQAQRRRPDPRVPAVPFARSHHPVSTVSCIVFGEALELPEKADREQQRALDFALLERIGGLLEIHLPHLLCGILYLRALHGRREPVARAALGQALTRTRDALTHPYVDPRAFECFEEEFTGALRYLGKHGMLVARGAEIVPRYEAILTNPPLDSKYRKRNPVRYYSNQLLHLASVCDTLEREAFF